MIEVHPEYIVDEHSNKKTVIIPFSEWKSAVEEMGELEDIRSCDAARSKEDEAVKEIDPGMVK